MKLQILLSVLVAMSGLAHEAPGCSLPTELSYQTEGEPEHLLKSNYLVIGVFAYQDNAESFSSYARAQGFSAQYGYYPMQGYYYVYTFASDSSEQVVAECLQLRDVSEFEDAWVLHAYETDPPINADWSDPEVNVPTNKTEGPSAIHPVDHQTLATDTYAPVVDKQLEQPATKPGHNVYFRTIDENNQPVVAVVKVVDGTRAEAIKQCQAHQPEVLEYDHLLSDQVQLITYAIGYQKTTFDLPLGQPISDSTALYVAVNHDTIQVTMPLEKLKKGDVQAMFNTYFYGNSSVMREPFA